MKINWSDNNAKVSKFFSVVDVTQCEPRRRPETTWMESRIIQFAQELDKVREGWGSPLVVTSWYMPPMVNKEVGGDPESQHVQGWAVDLYPQNGDLLLFQKWIDERWSGGLGYGVIKWFVHLDARNGYPAFGIKGGPRWTC